MHAALGRLGQRKSPRARRRETFVRSTSSCERCTEQNGFEAWSETEISQRLTKRNEDSTRLSQAFFAYPRLAELSRSHFLTLVLIVCERLILLKVNDDLGQLKKSQRRLYTIADHVS